MLHEYKWRFPNIHPSAFIASSAEIIGDVEIEEESSIWFHTVVRGDVNQIRIGKRTNIQDGSVVHANRDSPSLIGDEVTVGHSVTLEGCIIERGCLIGVGAIILANAVIGEGCVVAAGCVVREGERVPPGSLVAGVPGVVKRPVTEVERRRTAEGWMHYVEYARTYRSQASGSSLTVNSSNS